MNRATAAAAAAFAAAALAAVSFMVVYSVDAGPQAEGALVAVMFAGLAIGLVACAVGLMPGELIEEPRHAPGEGHQDAAGALAPRLGAITRRRVLRRLLLGAAGAVGLALLFPARSFGPPPGRRELYITAWRGGARVVDAQGRPVRADQLPQGALLTVFPEGNVDASDAQAVLVRLPPGRDIASPGRSDWAPRGHVAYSRLCTHMACPVGIYEQETNLLVCPCHQSTFDVLRGALPTFGPATRPLPQLPLAIDPEGFLVATGDFPAPVGSGFWRRP